MLLLSMELLELLLELLLRREFELLSRVLLELMLFSMEAVLELRLLLSIVAELPL